MSWENKYAKTKPPPLKGCKGYPHGERPFLGLHEWRYSSHWNGNDPKVLPFAPHKHGIARSGWRCYHCGTMVWDKTDTAYAADLARAWGVDVIGLIDAHVRQDA